MSKLPYWIAGIPIYSECTRIITTAEGREAVLKLATPANRTEFGVTRTYYSDSYTLAAARDCLIDLSQFETDDRDIDAKRKALMKVFETAYTRLGGSLEDLPYNKSRNGFNASAKATPKKRTASAGSVVAAGAKPAAKGTRRTARPV